MTDKASRARDAASATAQYEAEARATRAKTERLRALRLAREAATPVEPAKPTTKKKPAEKTKAVSLSRWLADQKRDGREP